MTLVQRHLSCSVVFLWSVDTIFIPRKTGTCKQSYSPTRTCGRATLGLKPFHLVLLKKRFPDVITFFLPEVESIVSALVQMVSGVG